MMNTFRLPWELRLEMNGSYATKRLGASNEKWIQVDTLI